MRKKSKAEMHEYLHASRQTGQHDVPPPSETVQRIGFIFGFYGVGSSVIPELGAYSVPEDAEDCLFSKLYEETGQQIA